MVSKMALYTCPEKKGRVVAGAVMAGSESGAEADIMRIRHAVKEGCYFITRKLILLLLIKIECFVET